MKNEKKSMVLKPRGSAVMLPHGGLPEIFSPYLADLIQSTGGAQGPIGRQFVSQPELEAKFSVTGLQDPLIEDEHEVAPGLVYKYVSDSEYKGVKRPYHFEGRALWTITRRCAAYCRFCTRGREVGMIADHEGKSAVALAHAPNLTEKQIDETLQFIKSKKGLTEIILSGGDPLTINPQVLSYVLGELGALQKSGKLRIVRIGTRVPVHNPLILRKEHYAAIKKIRNPRMMVHINHPAELTKQTRKVLRKFRTECNGIVMSQSVLLAGVNDNVQTLYDLFIELAGEGVVPYYIYQNDAVYWAKHFTVPIKKAIRLWAELRPMLSGVAATARFVLDVTHGYGKIPVPEGNAWDINYENGFRDFIGKQHRLDNE